MMLFVPVVCVTAVSEPVTAVEECIALPSLANLLRELLASVRHIDSWRLVHRFMFVSLSFPHYQGSMTDTVVHVEHLGRVEDIHCHAVVLARCPYFRAMLTAGMAESFSKVCAVLRTA